MVVRERGKMNDQQEDQRKQLRRKHGLQDRKWIRLEFAVVEIYARMVKDLKIHRT